MYNWRFPICRSSLMRFERLLLYLHKDHNEEKLCIWQNLNVDWVQGRRLFLMKVAMAVFFLYIRIVAKTASLISPHKDFYSCCHCARWRLLVDLNPWPDNNWVLLPHSFDSGDYYCCYNARLYMFNLSSLGWWSSFRDWSPLLKRKKKRLHLKLFKKSMYLFCTYKCFAKKSKLDLTLIPHSILTTLAFFDHIYMVKRWKLIIMKHESLFYMSFLKRRHSCRWMYRQVIVWRTFNQVWYFTIADLYL